jgi:serine/threonine protein kinase
MATCPTCRAHYGDEQVVCEDDGATLLPDEAFEHADIDLAPGTVVGEYHIDGKLGAVYRAVHPLIGKQVAIKVLNREHSSNPKMVGRFIDEARAVNQIRHRNIIDIFSFGSLPDGRHYFVMELLEGITLDRYITDRGRVAPEDALPILREVARALDAAHAHGVAHRDLKPDNVFLVDEGDRGLTVKLLDFGIAKLLVEASGQHKTRTGAPLGTPAYMSPEQCHASNVDQRTDIYSLGIVIHEALTGNLPFEGNSMMDMLLKQTGAKPPAMSSVIAELPQALDRPVLHMLEKDPANRPQTIVEAVEALIAAAKGVGIAVAGTPLTPTPRKSADSLPSPSGARSISGGAQVVRSTPGAVGAPHTPGAVAAPHTPGGLTPKDMESLGEAKTMVHARNTLQGAASDRKPSTPRGRVAIIGGAVAAVTLIGAAVWFADTGEPEVTALTPASSSAITSAPPAASAPVPSAVASAAPTATLAVDVPSDTVELEVESVPANTEVWLGEQKLGVLPGTVRVPKGTEKVKLVLRAAGYKDLEIEIVPKKDLALPTPQLVKDAPRPNGGKVQPKKASREELEIPNF